jgi:hypothetical protein
MAKTPKPADPPSTPPAVPAMPAVASTTAPTVAAVAIAAAPIEPLHDLAYQIGLVREALQSEKRRLGFFLGAGCPLGIFDKDGTASVKHIPDVAGLTEALAAALDADAALKPCWSKLTTNCTTAATPRPNVEHILTQLRTICSLQGASHYDGMPPDVLRTMDERICEKIAEIVGKSLPDYTTSYHRFAAWVGQIDRDHPVEIFTPNYDLLLEEGFEHYKVPFFDGFVGAREPFFDLAAMEHDAVPPRWTRVWKLHGSINWVRRGDDSLFRCFPVKKGQQLLIYPSHLKYEQSRRMPYLAMIDRLRAFFRDTNPVLVVCGYSFADEHLNEVLLDGLRGNRSAHCFALVYSDLASSAAVAAHAAKHSNLTVLAWDRAVIGTRSGAYKSIDRSLVISGCGFDVTPPAPGTSPDSPLPVHCKLGDFHHFALFLEAQFGVKVSDHAPA